MGLSLGGGLVHIAPSWVHDGRAGAGRAGQVFEALSVGALLIKLLVCIRVGHYVPELYLVLVSGLWVCAACSTAC